MNIIFYSVYNTLTEHDLDMLKVCLHSYDRTNTTKVKYIIFYFNAETELKVKSSNVDVIFKKVKFYKNNLSFKETVETDYITLKHLVYVFSYKIKCIELLSRCKYDLICHIDFDILFLKDLSKIFEYCYNSNNTIFGTKQNKLLNNDWGWKDRTLFTKGYFNLGFAVFKPQRIYKEFLQSRYLKSFIVDECFISVYKDFENIENLQLYKKIDNPEKYYILHFTKCGLVPSNTKLMFMPYYYKYYKNEVLNTDVSIKFKKFILNMFKNWYTQRIV